MNPEQEFVPYNIALEFKKAKAIIPCFGYYGIKDKEFYSVRNGYAFSTDNDCLAAPLWQQATTWLRDTHGIEMYIMFGGGSNSENYKWYSPVIPSCYLDKISSEARDEYNNNHKLGAFNTYNEALSAGVEKAIKLIN